jgi:hypothetical protein
MRKNIIGQAGGVTTAQLDDEWLDAASIGRVEVTSEAPEHPVESVFNFGKGPGWRSSGAGEQTIRLIFDEPQRVHRIWLRFVEPERERTQEFVLRWSGGSASPMREIARQQWNFSPGAAAVETEDYKVDLDKVAALELAIKGDISDNRAVATLAEWRVA